MSVYHIVFSPTGGTKKVSDIFTASFSSESILIDLTERSRDFSSCSFAETDTCIVSVPSYGGRVPDIAVTRLRQMNGNGASDCRIRKPGLRRHLRRTPGRFGRFRFFLYCRCGCCGGALHYAPVCRRTSKRPGCRDTDSLCREHPCQNGSRFSLLPSESARKPPLPGIRRRPLKACSRKILQPLRPLCRQMPHRRH